jgi:2',3'-cyclic-nucleotide 2'-phosphodiesterase (5'-nucleotidase family)
MPTMKATVDEVNTKIKAAVDDATTAYDDLIAELKNDKPNSTVVLAHSGQIWTSSLKAWANLVLAPGKIAAAITNEGNP